MTLLQYFAQVRFSTNMRPFRTNEPDVPIAGDWFQTTTVPMRFYKSSPAAALDHPWSGMARCGEIFLRDRLLPGSYIGPVHEVEKTERFISVRVPHPEDPTVLLWANVWKRTNHKNGSLQIALKVSHHILWRWQSRGWESRYVWHD